MPPPSQAVAEQPLWGKAVAAALGGGAVAAIFYVLLEFGRTERAKLILLGGVVAVAVLLLLYKLLLGWLRRRKAAPMTRSILANSSAAPHGISDPAKRAKLDEMRKSFEAGVAKFRAAGKDLYTLPWFVLVGEPGGGKTEAIRHSQVGFPHGLQDYMQGAGGTVNMNWWFTNHAIILDTAGRLMFEEVAPGASNEWGEFLHMLRQHRPNCPINGMVLVIPADSLIKDSAEAIERKAGKIAQQLDLIQRTLEVRFPVFVVVSKCDLISGFREFFETVDDPQLQGQILGWSNPMSLDQPFNPELVDEHLETVRQRLAARRYGLLLDPVHTEDPEARRIDQVDALYTFPDSLGRIGPRLRRYLETIFVAGEWSPKPLFLRGIYFTSSMREGAALDAELADVLKVPVDSLRDEGRIWERNKTYFLREPFLKKVFVEKGLVTRAARPNRLDRTRKVVVLTAGFVSIAALFGLTAVGVRDFKRKLGNESEYWPAVQKNYASWAIVDEGNNYAGVDPAAGLPRESAPRLGEFFADAPERVARNIDVPKAFAGPNLVFDQFSPEKRKAAYRTVYESSVIRPLVAQARKKLKDGTAWSRATPEGASAAMAALRELLRLEAGARAAENSPDRSAWQPRVDPEPLFKFVLSPSQYEQYAQQQDKLKLKNRDLPWVADWLYADDPNPARAPAWMGFTRPESRDAVKAGLDHFKEYWQKQVAQNDAWFDGVAALRQAVRDYQAASVEADNALSAVKQPVATTDDYAAFQKQLDTQVATLGKARAAVEKADKDVPRDPSRPSVAEEYAYRVRRLEQRAAQAYADLAQAVGPGDPFVRLIGTAPKRPPEAETSPSLGDLDDQLKATQAAALEKAPRYAARERVYGLALGDLTSAAPANSGAADADQLASAMATAKAQADARLGEVDQLAKQAGEERLSVEKACATWRLAVQAAAARQRRDAIAAVLDALPGATPEERVRGLVKTPQAHPVAVPFTAMNRPFEPVFDPAAAQKLILAVKNLRAHLPTDADLRAAAAPAAGGGQAPPAPQRVLDFTALRTRYDALQTGFPDYLDRYVAYWRDTVPKSAAFDAEQLQRWQDFFKDAKGQPRQWSAESLNIDLAEVVRTIRSALDVAIESGEPKAQAAARQAAADFDGVSRLMREDEFQKACIRVFQHWSLSQDRAATRQRILDSSPAQFKIEYVFPPFQGRFVSNYWSALSHQLLAVLVQDCEAAAAAEYRKNVLVYNRFPLVLNSPKDLKLEEVDAARDVLEKFLDGHWPDQAPAAAGDTVRFAQLPPDFPDRDLLARLRMPAGNPKRFASLGRTLELLSPTSPATCTISLMDSTARERRLAGAGGRLPDRQFSDIRVRQAGPAEHRLRVAPPPAGGKDLLLGKFNCRAGNPIVIEVSDRPVPEKQETWHSWQLPGPCAALRTLAADRNATPAPGTAVVRQAMSRGPRPAGGDQVWDVEVLVADNNKTVYSLWLTVSFDKDLPELGEWSQPIK